MAKVNEKEKEEMRNMLRRILKKQPIDNMPKTEGIPKQGSTDI
jgi:hypothetical protein